MRPRARTTMAQEFGRNLFMARRRAGLSQEALSKAAGLNRTVVGLLENGLRTPRLDTICLLARALGINPGELIDGLSGDPSRRIVNDD